MKRRIVNISVFVLSFISLIISMKLFWNLGIYADEFNTSPDIVLGGGLWLYMDWLRLGLLTIVCLISGINLFKKAK